MTTKLQNIRDLNDRFLKTFEGGKLMMSTGIQALGDMNVALILSSIQRFDQFTSDNDPHHEHNCGSFKHNGQKVCFMIDYYDNDLERESPDPSDPKVTTRVLTILFASEL